MMRCRRPARHGLTAPRRVLQAKASVVNMKNMIVFFMEKGNRLGNYRFVVHAFVVLSQR
jgi:hypothetical protein